MIKLNRGKKVITILLSICIILLAFFSTITIVEKHNKNHNSPQAGTIVFGRLPCYADWDLYKNNDTFEIGDAVALEAFSNSVKNEDKDGNYCTFEGKIVRLTADIDWQNYFQDYLDYGYFDEEYPGAEDKVVIDNVWSGFIMFEDYNKDHKITKAEIRRWYQEKADNKESPVWQPIGADIDISGSTYQGTPGQFKGTFDGDGHTISNLRYKVSDVGDGFYDYMHMGFFAVLDSCTVKNLKLTCVTINTFNSFNCGFYVSVMAASVGYGVTFENCVIESVYLNWNLKAHDPYFGGFYCYNRGYKVALKNCLLKDFNIYEQDGNLSNGDMERIYLLGPSKHAAGGNSPISVEYAYENVVLNDIKSVFSPINPYLVPGGVDFIYYLLNQNMSNYALGNGLEYLSKEDAVARLKNNNLWYLAPEGCEWNNGWPYLVDFIKFEQYLFIASTGGTILGGMIPGSAEAMAPEGAEFSINLGAKENYVCGFLIQAVPDDGHYFTEWTRSDDGKTYTANFAKEEYIINIIVYNEDGDELKRKEISHKYGDQKSISFGYEDSNMIIEVAGIEVANISNGLKYKCVKMKYADEDLTALRLPIVDLGDNGAETELKIYIGLKSYKVEYK